MLKILFVLLARLDHHQHVPTVAPYLNLVQIKESVEYTQDIKTVDQSRDF